MRLGKVLSNPLLPLLLGKVGFGVLHLGAGDIHLCLVVGTVKASDDVSLAHMAAFFHPQFSETSLNLGGNHSFAAGHNVSGCGEDGRARNRLAEILHRGTHGLNFSGSQAAARDEVKAQRAGNQDKKHNVSQPSPGRAWLRFPVNAKGRQLGFQITHDFLRRTALTRVSVFDYENAGC